MKSFRVLLFNFYFLLMVGLVMVSTPSLAQKKVDKTKKNTPVLKNGVDSLSYALGLQVAEFYKMQGLDTISGSAVQRAFEDVFQNKNLLMSKEQCDMTVQEQMELYMKKKINANKEEGKKFLEENKKRTGVVALPNGLQYEILIEGNGPKPKATDKVKAHYKGTLLNGFEFDNSYKRGTPLQISLNGVIKGWTEALQLMPVGSKWKIYIPSELGYGDRNSGQIPGGSLLIFEIELLDIVSQ